MPRPPKSDTVAGRDRILETCVTLFARSGFHGVSMRDVAREAGLTPAALYHHFSDKDQLYLATIARVYDDRFQALTARVEGDGDPWHRLEALVSGVILLNQADPQLLRLSQWVLLDDEPSRTQKLVSNVLRPFFDVVTGLAGELGGGYDAHRLAVSVLGLVFYPIFADSVTRHLPGYQSVQAQPDAQAAHIVRLLRHGIAGEVS